VCERPGAARLAVHERLASIAPRRAESALDFVRRAATGHDMVWVVAPESEGLLRDLQQAIAAPRWVGCDANTLRIASSKRATLAALAARGVTTPLAFADAEATRWIVKPDDGAGAVDTRVHRSHAAALADWQQRQHAGGAATLETFVEGEALSISLLAEPGFVQPLAFNRQLIRIDVDGGLHYECVRINAIDARHDARATPLHLLALAVARALPGLRGFVGIDLVWHAERGPVVIEVNPRLTCAYVGLSAALGRNLAEEVLLLHSIPAQAEHALA
jgi:tyramine---L-glutamate ligase